MAYIIRTHIQVVDTSEHTWQLDMLASVVASCIAVGQ